MSYARDREQTIAAMARHGIGYDDATWFLRQASTLQRISEILSSIDVGERETARLEKKDTRTEERVHDRARDLGFRVAFQGDPRGAPFTLYQGIPERTVEIHVPGRGLPASAFC